MRGNESHAWSTWRTAKAKERRGYLDDPAEAKQSRRITEEFLRTRSMEALTWLEQDARSFADFIADLLIQIEQEIQTPTSEWTWEMETPEKVTEPPTVSRFMSWDYNRPPADLGDEEAGR